MQRASVIKIKELQQQNRKLQTKLDQANAELRRIANANMVTPLALYHQRSAEATNAGYIKYQMLNAKLRKVLRVISAGAYQVDEGNGNVGVVELTREDMQREAEIVLEGSN